ncbi:SusD/RagB family nutrient-binding outer membrane lipoprotein [Tenacibaculum finnmarkense]|uniref:SusD/RagB family nutrient-binding outer membrane lipoprotein n=1 Tax=Tenacibaculum finnmarkense TaxID=2781243 RepID=UPI001E3920ED|nr:SusD/RagB family nutrient-binding outer membrane lipoprotein [Tenacibaculum finnmarkense]MCD8444220.1 SusD/RagB family nutrient-binding outer membrane lipoprotein [Tenacibaculum finnmarkense genomovar ulcerans]
MKKIIYAVIFVVLSACTNGFETINTNPNSPENASEQLLLPSIIFDLSNHLTNESYGFGEVISQYGAYYEFNDLDIYRWQSDDRFWSPMYAILEDVKDLKQLAKEHNNTNYLAVGLVLEAYIFSVITDAYGDVPYSEANRTKEGIINPKYDAQKEIYKNLLLKLSEANKIIKLSKNITGDILYQGDMLRWKKFANSLHLRMLLRTSKVQNNSVAFNQMIANPAKYPIFESNADNATYNFSGSLPDISSVCKPGGGRAYDYFRLIPTTHLIRTMQGDNDPRIHVLLSPKKDSQNLTLGVAPGQALGAIGRPDAYSRKSTACFESATMVKGVLLNYSELNFILAEAKEKGLISVGNAAAYYNKAVKANFDDLKVQMPADFLTNTAVYNSTSEILYEQKWLSLYHVGLEAWFDWKRSKKPSFIKAGSGNLNGNLVPVRLLYPSLEKSVNKTNYKKASSAMGGDTMNAAAWWW